MEGKHLGIQDFQCIPYSDLFQSFWMTFSTLDSRIWCLWIGSNLQIYQKNQMFRVAFFQKKKIDFQNVCLKIWAKKSDPFLEKNTWCLIEKSLQDQISKSISETCWFAALLNWRFACLFQTYAQNLVWNIISHTLSPNKKWIGDSITKLAVPTGCQQKNAGEQREQKNVY